MKMPLPYSASPFEPKNSIGMRLDCSFVLCTVQMKNGVIFDDLCFPICSEKREWNGIIELICNKDPAIGGNDYKILSAEWVKGTCFGHFDETKLKHMKCVGYDCPEDIEVFFICFDNEERPEMNAEEFEKFKKDCIKELKKEKWTIL